MPGATRGRALNEPHIIGITPLSFRVLADDEQSKARRAKLAELAQLYAELAVRAKTKP